MPFTDKELKKLRADLPRGSAVKLAEIFGLKAASVRNILSGLSNNEEVIIAAYALLTEHNNKVSNTKAALSA